MPHIMKKSRFGKNASKDQKDTLVGICELRRSYRDEYSLQRRNTVRNYEIARGNSFHRGLRAILESRGLPVADVSMVLPKIQAALGNYIQNRGTIRAVPMRDFAEDDAEFGNKLLDWSNLNNYRESHFFDAVKNSLISDIPAGVNTFWDDNEGEFGMPMVESLHPLDLIIDPKAPVYDDKQHRFRGREVWMDRDEILEATDYKFMPEIERILDEGQRGALSPFADWIEALTGDWQSTETEENARDMFYDRKENLWKVIELTIPERLKTYEVVRTDLDMPIHITDDLAEARELESQAPSAFIVRTKVKPQMKTYITLGDMAIMSEFRRKVQNGLFKETLIPGFNYGGKNFSLVSALAPAQTGYEQAMTMQMIRAVTSAISGYFIQKGSLSRQQRENFDANISSPGAVIEYEAGYNRPEPIEPPSINSQEAFNMEQFQLIGDRISSTGDSQLGISSGANESGKLNISRINQTIINQQPLFVGIKRSEINVARNIIALSQVHLTPGEIFSIVTEDDFSEQTQVPENFEYQEYFVKMIRGAKSDTQRMFNALEFGEFVRNIAPEHIPRLYKPMVKYMISGVQDKAEILELLTEQQEVPEEVKARIGAMMQEANNIVGSVDEEPQGEFEEF